MDLNQPKNNANALSQNLPGVTIETNLVLKEVVADLAVENRPLSRRVPQVTPAVDGADERAE